MTGETLTFVGGDFFDGARLRRGVDARFVGGRLDALGPRRAAAPDGRVVDLDGDLLSPGYVDLQVNGGGGAMLNDDPSVETLRRIADAHRRLGVARLLPTLITADRATTRAAVEAAAAAVADGAPGVAGLHLEGPHISVARKGAHDAAFIRPMEAADLAFLIDARARLPALMVTVAPESVSETQTRAMAEAGIVVSLGHSDADYEACARHIRAGASCVTHLFNAMSGLGHRAPGLVGAALDHGAVCAGLVADGIHVHRAAMAAAWRAKRGPGRLFLVSDAMAVAGTELAAFSLGGRRVRRAAGRLTLDDGALAGADLDLTQAVRRLAGEAGIGLQAALAAATSTPEAVIGLRRGPRFRLSEMIRLTPGLALRPVMEGDEDGRG